VNVNIVNDVMKRLLVNKSNLEPSSSLYLPRCLNSKHHPRWMSDCLPHSLDLDSLLVDFVLAPVNKLVPTTTLLCSP